jgi:hypothetical protein
VSPTPFFLYPFPPPYYLFHLSYLPSVFIQNFPAFSLSLSLSLSPFATSIPPALNYLFLLIVHSAPSFLSFHPIPFFSILVHTSKSRHHFSFSFTVSPQVLRNYLCHTLLILPVVSAFFDSLSSFLLVCVFVPFTQLYIYSSPFCFQSFHFFTGIPVFLVVFLSPSSSCFCFHFSPAFH